MKAKAKPRTHKGASKRFKITGSGKVLHRGQGVRHRITHKAKSAVRRQRRMKLVEGTIEIKVKKLLRIA
jgi:large subunit ribosomal protein L35